MSPENLHINESMFRRDCRNHLERAIDLDNGLTLSVSEIDRHHGKYALTFRKEGKALGLVANPYDDAGNGWMSVGYFIDEVGDNDFVDVVQFGGRSIEEAVKALEYLLDAII